MLQLILSALVCIQIAAVNGHPYRKDGGPQMVQFHPEIEAGLFDEAGIFLTVNALASVDAEGNFLDRMLELNWYNFEVFDGDWIGLFNYDISTNYTEPEANALVKVNPLVATGTIKTNVRFQRENSSETISSVVENKCLGFWIAYFKGANPGVPSKVNCLMRFPNWMGELKDTIGNVPLTSLMIPGSHDAGSWKLYAGKPDDNVVVKYTITQEETIYNQLVHGIRYLDVRVAHYPATEEKFWINHDVFRIRPIISLFEDVKRFVSETNEIVFMDFHNFPVGFEDKAVHDELLQFVTLHLGDYLLKKSVVGLNPTANHVWATNASIFLTYSEDSISRDHDFLFPNLRHAWANTNQLHELESYLNGAKDQYGCRGNFWSAMAELTPTTNDIILKPNFGLRGFAQLVNIPVTEWYRQESWYSKSNIISTDFFLGNNIIEMSVEVNRRRASCP
jgi:hypothetical protein